MNGGEFHDKNAVAKKSKRKTLRSEQFFCGDSRCRIPTIVQQRITQVVVMSQVHNRGQTQIMRHDIRKKFYISKQK